MGATSSKWAAPRFRPSVPARLIRVRFPPPDRKLPELTLRELLAPIPRRHRFSRARWSSRGSPRRRSTTACSRHTRRACPRAACEINAAAFETMAQGLYIRDVSEVWVSLFAMLLVAAAGASFRYLRGWRAYVVGALLVVAASAAPYAAFTHRRVFSFTTSVSAAWLGGITAAAYYHLVARSLRRSEAERARYQQAMHFVTHEMRTPLSAIQGSSELISRYALTEEKRKQMAQLINSESKRLARMVEIFLNVERLSAGQMELKRETIPVERSDGDLRRARAPAGRAQAYRHPHGSDRRTSCS